MWPAHWCLAGGGSFFKMPGIRKSSGETVCEALMPPQPPVQQRERDKHCQRHKFPI